MTLWLFPHHCPFVGRVNWLRVNYHTIGSNTVFDVVFVVNPSKLLNKVSCCWRFETQLRSFNVTPMSILHFEVVVLLLLLLVWWWHKTSLSRYWCRHDTDTLFLTCGHCFYSVSCWTSSRVVLICNAISLTRHHSQGLYSLSGRTSYHKISWSLEATRFGCRLFQSLWNLTGTSAAVLPRCLSNFRAIR